MPRKLPRSYGPLGGFLATVDFWRIQVASFGQPRQQPTRHPEDASGLLVIASSPDDGPASAVVRPGLGEGPIEPTEADR